ncbi:MAG TPA: hypothetical protein DEB06_03635 [Phycisphaerales bacterium]|nr:hypothetical protein [Phycisphaerales bacterium]
MPQEAKAGADIATLAALAAGDKPTLQGLVATREDELALLGAFEKAFDYRGDVTLTLTDGAGVFGYIFDRRIGAGLADSSVRLLTPDSDAKVTITLDRVARLEFTGRDAAAGKSFETWVKKYIEKKRAGEQASIESERLE